MFLFRTSLCGVLVFPLCAPACVRPAATSSPSASPILSHNSFTHNFAKTHNSYIQNFVTQNSFTNNFGAFDVPFAWQARDLVPSMVTLCGRPLGAIHDAFVWQVWH